MSATIACLGSVGPGLAEVGPTKSYAFLPDAAKLLLSSLMVFGRLELFTSSRSPHRSGSGEAATARSSPYAQ